MSNLILPGHVTEVTLAADNDAAREAQALLQRSVDFHAAAGRTVRIWRSTEPGQDLNDALQHALQDVRPEEKQ